MKCEKCGAEILAGENFCNNCGAKITLENIDGNDKIETLDDEDFDESDEKIETLVDEDSNESNEKIENMVDVNSNKPNGKNNTGKKSKKRITLFLIFLIVLILAIVGMYIFNYINANKPSNKLDNKDDDVSINKDDDNSKDDDTSKDDEQKLPDNEDDNSEKIQLYIYKYRRYMNGDNFVDYLKVSNEQFNEDNYTLLNKYTCIDSNCHSSTEPMEEYNSNYTNVVIYDKDYLLYNYETKEKTKLNVSDKNITSINLLKTNSAQNNHNGAIVKRGSNENTITAIYDLDSNKYVTDFAFYDNYYYVDKDLLLAYDGGNKAKAFSLKKLKMVNDSASTGPCISGQVTITKVPLKNSSKAIYSYNDLKSGAKSLLDSALNPLINDFNYSKYTLNSDASFTVMDSGNRNNYYIYDVDGNQIYKSKDYIDIIKLSTDYVIVNDNNVIKVVDYKEKNEYAMFEISNNMVAVYSKDDISDDSIELSVISQPDVQYFKSYASTLYSFNISNKKISTVDRDITINETHNLYKIS